MAETVTIDTAELRRLRARDAVLEWLLDEHCEHFDEGKSFRHELHFEWDQPTKKHGNIFDFLAEEAKQSHGAATVMFAAIAETSSDAQPYRNEAERHLKALLMCQAHLAEPRSPDADLEREGG